MPEFKVHDGAFFRAAKQLHFRGPSGWVKAREVWVRTATQWVRAFVGGFATFKPITGNAYGVSGSSGEVGRAGLIVGAEGAWYFGQTSIDGLYDVTYQGDWGSPVASGAGAGYELMTAHVSGSNIGGHGSWATLSSDFSREVFGSFGGGHISTTFTVTIREIGTTTNLISSNVTLAAGGLN